MRYRPMASSACDSNGGMQAEGERDGANGVVGVGFEISNYAWGLHTVEFYAAGTASGAPVVVKPSRRRSCFR
jgi:uncharacterized protein YbjQ (UPF0145 family)